MKGQSGLLGAVQGPWWQPSWNSSMGQSLHQAPGAAGVAAPVQQGARRAVLVRVVVGGRGRGQRGLVDDLDRRAWATQGCGATGVGGGRGVAGESLA